MLHPAERVCALSLIRVIVLTHSERGAVLRLLCRLQVLQELCVLGGGHLGGLGDSVKLRRRRPLRSLEL